MSERGTHLAVARTRAGITMPPATSERAAIAAAVLAVPDPELPVVTIGDLGMVHTVDVDAATIRVALLPTFIGCPAIDLMADAIAAALAPYDRAVDVRTTFEEPWTSERISSAGCAALVAAGIAPPTELDEVVCPHCRSRRVVMDNAFGPTQCRALYYCRDCRQPFEAMKRV